MRTRLTCLGKETGKPYYMPELLGYFNKYRDLHHVSKIERNMGQVLPVAKKCYCNKRQLQSLLGSLLYVSKCVRSSRFFLNRLLDALRSMEGKKYTKITTEAKRDINWFSKFISVYNGVTFCDHKPIAHSIELDASLQGLGARWALRFTP